MQQHRSGGKGKRGKGNPHHTTPLSTIHPLTIHSHTTHHTHATHKGKEGREGKEGKGREGKGKGKRERGSGGEKEGKGGPFVCGLGMMCGVGVGCEWMFCGAGLCSVTRVREKKGKK